MGKNLFPSRRRVERGSRTCSQRLRRLCNRHLSGNDLDHIDAMADDSKGKYGPGNLRLLAEIVVPLVALGMDQVHYFFAGRGSILWRCAVFDGATQSDGVFRTAWLAKGLCRPQRVERPVNRRHPAFHHLGIHFLASGVPDGIYRPASHVNLYTAVTLLSHSRFFVNFHCSRFRLFNALLQRFDDYTTSRKRK